MSKKTMRRPVNLCVLIVCTVLLWAVPAASAAAEDVEGQLELTYEHVVNVERQIEATLTVDWKDEGTLPVENVEIHFFIDAEAGEQQLGTAVTDEEGRAQVTMEANDPIGMNEEGLSTFTVRAEHPDLGSLKETIEVKDGTLDISFDEEEHAIHATFMQLTPDGTEPVAFASVQFYVLRYFGDIGFHGDFTMTGDDGVVIEEFPKGYPGDEEGNVEMRVQVDGHDSFGTISLVVDVPWGVVVEEGGYDRALWAGRDAAPWWLIIAANSLLAAGWGTIAYVLLLVVRIRRAEPEARADDKEADGTA